MADSRDLMASKDPANLPIPYITTELPPRLAVAGPCQESGDLGGSTMFVVGLSARETLS